MKSNWIAASLLLLMLGACEKETYDLRTYNYPVLLATETESISYTGKVARFETTLLLHPALTWQQSEALNTSNLKIDNIQEGSYLITFTMDSVTPLPDEVIAAEHIFLIDQSTLAKPEDYDYFINNNYKLRGLVGYTEKTSYNTVPTKFYAHAKNNPYLEKDIVLIGDNQSPEKLRDSLLSLSFKYGGTLNVMETLNAIIAEDSFFSQTPNVQKYITCVVSSYSGIAKTIAKQTALAAKSKGIIINLIFSDYSEEQPPNIFNHALISQLSGGFYHGMSQSGNYISFCNGLGNMLIHNCTRVRLHYTITSNVSYWSAGAGVWNYLHVTSSDMDFLTRLHSVIP